ncbi:MAG: IMP dehydrogenase [Chloroflexi bacterium]|nr:IMP dehydrogenase [Chloroflexota bacterium]MBI3763813.1 IMP dehydrogenase [Chloroflexota bacterium]
MNIRSSDGLTFDDVLLVPKRSAARSRAAASTAAHLTKNLRLAVPIVSANMDTVTEANMAIAMARAGGIGIIHRFMPIDRQAAEIARVKRAESFVVEDPMLIAPNDTVAVARSLMAANGIGGLAVVDYSGVLAGLVTTRDVLFAPDDAPVSSVMTPRERLITLTAPQGSSLEEARAALHQHRIEKLPIVDGVGRLQGLITAQDIIKIGTHPDASKDAKGRLRAGAAIGVRPDDLDRAGACLAAGADMLVLDIAHGHADHAIAMLREVKRQFPKTEVVAGNVATGDGVRDLAEAGADAVKVGVGSGSICITRQVAGFGVPQLTAIVDCAEAAHRIEMPLIADGGIRKSGDLVKALAAGASTAMVGSLLAGTVESPGANVIRDGRRYKVVRGMASLTANIDRKRMEQEGEVADEDWERVVPEGVEAVVPFRGEAAEVVHQLVGGLRSGLSYAGANTIEDLWEKAEFVRMTPAGMKESGVHDVERL